MDKQYEGSAKYYLYDRSGNRQEINNSATFVVNAGEKLNISTDTESLTVPLQDLQIPIQFYTGLENGIPTYEPNPFFSSLNGTPLCISQVTEDGGYWQVLGSLTSYDGYEYPESLFNVTNLTVQVETVKKVQYSDFATENGTVWCNNGSILNLVLLLNNTFIYTDNTQVSYLRNDLADITRVNLIGNKIYLSKPPIQNKKNYAEVWEFKPGSDGRLDVFPIRVEPGAIYPPAQESTLLSTSYYPPK